MYPYPIRLHGPWEVSVAGAAPTRVTMPRLLPATGPTVLQRRFGLPRTIDDFERVWLVAEDVRGSSVWRLNGEKLGDVDGGSVEFEITARLRPRNDLVVEIPNAAGEVGFAGDVGLVIQCAAFLRNLRARSLGGRVVVTGFVAGDCADSLEIYLLAEGRSCGYLRRRAGEAFELMSDEPIDAAEVQIELVNRSAVWHAEQVVVSAERRD